MRQSTGGFSFIETLLVLAVLAFLLMHVSWPGLSRSRETRMVDAVMTDYMNSISLARQAAVSENTMVTFCRSNDGRHCQGKWHEGSIIFTDHNSDRVMNGDDRLLFRLEAIRPNGDLSFNSFRNRQYLQFTPRGITNYQNGNFTYCPDNGDMSLARQVIVNLTARARRAKDNDGDGIVENSQGKPLNCD